VALGLPGGRLKEGGLRWAPHRRVQGGRKRINVPRAIIAGAGPQLGRLGLVKEHLSFGHLHRDPADLVSDEAAGKGQGVVLIDDHVVGANAPVSEIVIVKVVDR